MNRTENGSNECLHYVSKQFSIDETLMSHNAKYITIAFGNQCTLLSRGVLEIVDGNFFYRRK
jgi:hypothetical protein